MKFTFLLPPSEGKNLWWIYSSEELSFAFNKPQEILLNTSEKDLKCTWNRFNEAKELNSSIPSQKTLPAIERYSWVMYNAIWYEKMTQKWQQYFNENYLIFSGLYWILSPQDKISNYKLPIEAKWLSKFWQKEITNTLNKLESDYIVNLLPLSYMKMIDLKNLNKKVININFLKEKDWKIQKISHWVKKIKWEFISKICENNYSKIEDFWWEIIEKWNEININLMH